MACPVGGMQTGIALAAVALLAVLIGSAWTRRAEWDLNGESGAMLLGLLVCFIAVIFILVALAGNSWF
jgi:uncharacterized protein YybS (DUF2232 family)